MLLLAISAKHSTCLIKEALFHGCSLASQIRIIHCLSELGKSWQSESDTDESTSRAAIQI
jgi:hypothetical protein